MLECSGVTAQLTSPVLPPA